jgi:hypothetical protein
MAGQDTIILKDLSPEVIAAIGVGGDATSLQSIPLDTNASTTTEITEDTQEGVYKKNLIKQSQTFNTSPWNKTRLTVNTSTGVASPIPGVDYMGLVGSVDINNHFLWQNATWINESRITFATYFKNANLDLIQASIDTTSNDLTVVFNLIKESFKVSVGIGEVEMIKISDGEFLTIISTENDNTETPILKITPVEVEGTETYEGDGSTIDIYAIGAHVHEYKIQERIGYAPTTTDVNNGEQAYTPNGLYKNRPRYVVMGDSTSFGSFLGYTYPRELQRLHPEYEFVNLAQSGAETDELIRTDVGVETTVQLLPAIGKLFFDFVQETSVYPFGAVNSSTLSIDTNSLKVVRSATVDGLARIKVINKKQNITVTGQFKGDGVANPVVKSVIDGTVLATGTTSTDYQDFSFTFKAAVDFDGFDFIVNGGGDTNFINITNLTIADDDYRTTTAILEMSGINSISASVSVDDICSQKAFMIKHANLQNIPVVALPILPIFGAFTEEVKQIAVGAVNDWVWRESDANHIINLDEMGDSNYEMHSDWTDDNLHPNETGYIKLGQIVNSQYFLYSIERKSNPVKIAKLFNIKTGLEEVPTPGNQYEAPDQTQEITNGGRIIREYFTNISPTATDFITGAAELVNQRWTGTLGGTTRMSFMGGTYSGSDLLRCKLILADNNIDMERTGVWTDINGWVEYIEIS